MDIDTATQTGLYYAFGREDASDTQTVNSPADPDTSGYLAFAEAYAAGWDTVNIGERRYMPGVRQAYECWQESGGRTIFDATYNALDSGPAGGDTDQARMIENHPGMVNGAG